MAYAEYEYWFIREVLEDEYKDLPRYVTWTNDNNYRRHAPWVFRKAIQKENEKE